MRAATERESTQQQPQNSSGARSFTVQNLDRRGREAHSTGNSMHGSRDTPHSQPEYPHIHSARRVNPSFQVSHGSTSGPRSLFDLSQPPEEGELLEEHLHHISTPQPNTQEDPQASHQPNMHQNTLSNEHSMNSPTLHADPCRGDVTEGSLIDLSLNPRVLGRAGFKRLDQLTEDRMPP